MSELSRIQQDMMSFLLGNGDSIKADVVDTKQANAKERLAIYGNGYGYRLLDALSENYPTVHTLLGDDDFYNMAYRYIDSYPSQHFSLRYLGSELEKFFVENYPETPVFAEMARFEWALRNAFDAKNETPIKIDALQEIPMDSWGGLTFRFHQSVSRLNLSWNTPQLWAAIEAESDPIPAEKFEHPYGWLIWRNDLINHYRSLDVDEAWALDSALSSVVFENLCQGLCEWVDEAHAPTRVASLLSNWINEGLIVEIHL